MNNIKPLRFFELIIKPCSRTYGVAPCTAAIGVTGDKKCYNSPRTCQDQIHYLAGDEQVIRFVESTEDLPLNFDAIPCLTDINRRPQKVDPSESIGVRESGTATMINFKYNDALFDPYLSDRDFNTYNQGTFWGKFSARWGNLQGSECRVVDGFVGQDIDEMTRRYYVIESQSGPDSDGKTSFTFKDVLKLLDGDKAQAPQPSLGTLFAAISETDLSLTLVPAGIGSTYPASGWASMGDEAVTFTRVGDVFALTRAVLGSKLDEHDAGETFQIGIKYTNQSPADIIYDLIANYSDTPSEYIDLTAWQNEINTNIGRLYSGMIMTPTPIKTLLNELVSEVGLIFFTDLVAKKISIKAMRAFVPTISINDDMVLAGSITSTPLLEKRISDVWVYYGKRNPLEKQEVKKNFRAIYADQTQNSIVALEDLPSSIREINSRWIETFNLPAAEAVAESIIARYEIAPRQVAFRLHPNVQISEGQAINVSSRIFEDDEGNTAPEFQCQVLQVTREPENITVLSEEVKFTQIPAGTDRNIYINEDAYNINLRSVHDSIYLPPTSGDIVTLIIAGGKAIGSYSTMSFALDIGSWPAGVTIKIAGLGRISGRGGNGGTGTSAGENGGPSIYTRYPIEITSAVKIFGGGGGGGGNIYGGTFLSGGGGAGVAPGTGAANGTPDSGGSGGPVAAGGNAGLPGYAGIGAGGSAGVSIDGISYVTITGTPDIRGPQIN